MERVGTKKNGGDVRAGTVGTSIGKEEGDKSPTSATNTDEPATSAPPDDAADDGSLVGQDRALTDLVSIAAIRAPTVDLSAAGPVTSSSNVETLPTRGSSR